MSELPEQNQETYLGDGLYVSFDGYQIILRARLSRCDHFVALEPLVWSSLIEWPDQYPKLKAHMNVEEKNE